jgi:hypothetical protein
MSETPRTDEYAGMSEDFRWLEVVSAEFARQLETELAEARAEIEALKRVNVALNEEIKIQRAYVTGRDNTIERKDKLIKQMREALSLILEGAIHDFHYVCQHRDNCLCWSCQKKRVNAALSAAERLGE